MNLVQIKKKNLLEHEGELLASVSAKLKQKPSTDQIAKIRSEIRNPNSFLIFSMQIAIDRYLTKKIKGTDAYKKYAKELTAYQKSVRKCIEIMESSPISSRLVDIAEEIREDEENNNFDQTLYGLKTLNRHLSLVIGYDDRPLDPDKKQRRPSNLPLEGFIEKVALFYEENFEKDFSFSNEYGFLNTEGSEFAKCWFEYARNISKSLGCKEFYPESSFITACKRAVSSLKAAKY